MTIPLAVVPFAAGIAPTLTADIPEPVILAVGPEVVPAVQVHVVG